MHSPLATLSLLALSSVAQAQTKAPISAALYTDLTYYASLAEASYTAPCPNAPHNTSAIKYISIPTTDTQATLFRAPDRNQLILTFPGTASPQDALTDLTFLPLPYLASKACKFCSVHAGFLAAWSSVQGDVTSALTSALKAPENAGYDIQIAAHSLGGAIAQLAFAQLKADKDLGPSVKGAYTFGQPRVGNQAFADFVDQVAGASDTAEGVFRRVTHADDGVPQLPPTLFGFRHSRTEYWEEDAADGKPSLQTTFRCFGQEPADCNDSAGGQGINAAHGGYAGFEDGKSCDS